MLDAKLAASLNMATVISNAPRFASALLGWNSISPGDGMSRSSEGVLVGGVGVASNERGDLRQRPRILEELDVIAIAAIPWRSMQNR